MKINANRAAAILLRVQQQFDQILPCRLAGALHSQEYNLFFAAHMFFADAYHNFDEDRHIYVYIATILVP